jgi:hypothetical protein
MFTKLVGGIGKDKRTFNTLQFSPMVRHVEDNRVSLDTQVCYVPEFLEAVFKS